MRKTSCWALFICIFLIFFLVISTFNVKSTTLMDSEISSIIYVGGDGPNNYSRIQNAIDNASNGSIIFVFKGIYYEKILIDREICLIGESRNSTVINGNGTKDIISIISNDVSISNFTIINGHFGIVSYNSSNLIIRDNNIFNNLHGISIHDGSSLILIFGNNFSDNVYSIRLYSCSRIRVHFNNFDSYKIHAYFNSNSIVQRKYSWNFNYWDSSRILPYPIYGKFKFNNILLPMVNFDWRPLIKPYTHNY